MVFPPAVAYIKSDGDNNPTYPVDEDVNPPLGLVLHFELLLAEVVQPLSLTFELLFNSRNKVEALLLGFPAPVFQVTFSINLFLFKPFELKSQELVDAEPSVI